MSNKIKAVAVSYLNTKPLLYGLLRGDVAQHLDLSLAIPSECARQLRTGEVDLGLVPVAVLSELPEWHLVGDYCIGARGAVETVCVYGDVPLEEMDAIYLDHHSRTSVALLRILLRDYWHRQPELLPATEGYIHQIGGRTGGLVIGDRTIGLDQRFSYIYDLGEAWTAWTGLPFVFAAWVSPRPVDPAFEAAFTAAQALGIAAIPELKFLLQPPQPSFDLEHYYTHAISYELDEGKRAALKEFLKLKASLPKQVGKAG
ncbi:MAG: menaquinone biosynthesis protein [Lewinella sp.]|nr:menaquinone biosynthesis protein [Lewinella sp.]